MSSLYTSKSIYHAKRGNFAGFRLSLPLTLDEMVVYSLFEDIRNTLIDIEEEHETWFTLKEFEEYQMLPQVAVILTEVADVMTRMKLRRAAKRTSMKRSRKRFMRRKIRKNQAQLKKRAYGQVKTILRKKLSGGRPWNKLSMSTRMRIDASINKRKPILIRMVRSRIPRMATQETKRLQRVRLNNSFEPLGLNVILESRRGPSAKGSLAPTSDSRKRKKDGARQRQRKYREKLDTNITEFIKTVVVGKKDGKYELIEKTSVKGHTDVKGVSSIAQAISVCGKFVSGEFRITPTSERLCGNLRGAQTSTKRKKGTNNMSSNNKSGTASNTSGSDLPIEVPQIPYEDQPGDIRDLPDMFKDETFMVSQDYSAELGVLGIVLVSRMNRSSNVQLGQDLEDIQALLEDKDNLTNGDIELIDDIYDRLSKSGLSEDELELLVSNKSLYTISQNQFDSAFKEQDAENSIIFKNLDNFGLSGRDTINQYCLVPMEKRSVGVVRADLDGTSKSDICAVYIPALISFLGLKDNISEKELNRVAQEHIEYMNIITGGASVLGTQKLRKSNIAAAIEYDKKFQYWVIAGKDDAAQELIEYRSTYNSDSSALAYGAYVGISVKSGPSRLASSSVVGDGNNILSVAYNRALSESTDTPADNAFVDEFTSAIEKLLESMKSGQVRANNTTSISATTISNAKTDITEVEENKQKVVTMLTDLTTSKNLHNNNFASKFTKEVLRCVLTGDGRISARSPGMANHLLSSAEKTSANASMIAIDDKLLDVLIQGLITNKGLNIDFAIKKRGINNKNEREYTNQFNDLIIKIQRALRSGKSVGETLTAEDAEDTKAIESVVLENIYSGYAKLDAIGGNREELLKQYKESGADLKDISGEAYLISNDIQDKQYNISTVLSIMKDIVSSVVQKQQIRTESFSYNSLLSFLVKSKVLMTEEIENETQPSEKTEEALKSELSVYVGAAKRSIGTGPYMLGKLLRFLEIEFNIFTDFIDFTDLILKSNTYGETNTIRIGKIEIKIPINTLESSSSEFYKSIGKKFLSEAKKRDYKKEYEDFHGTPQHIKERSKRVLARRLLAKLGRVHKGDGKDVDHRDGNPMNNSQSNLHAINASTNRAKH